MKVHELKTKSKKNRKRVGRGIAAGQGKTAGRGTKGQGARSGGGVRPGFEGGQNPLAKRLPKLRGFNRPGAVKTQIVHTDELNRLPANKTVDNAALAAAGIIKNRRRPVKLLYRGAIDKKFKIEVQAVSRQAAAAAKEAGATLELKPLKSTSPRKSNSTQ